MESFLHHRSRVAVLLGVLVLGAFFNDAARADEHDAPFTDPVNVTVSTNPSQVTIDARTATHYPGAPGVSAVGGGSGCWLQRTNVVGDILYPGLEAYPQITTYPFFVICDGRLEGMVWLEVTLGDEQAATAATDPISVAMRVRDELPIPLVDIAANPGRGLVGVKTWFWITGYDGSDLTRETPAFGSVIEVRATPEQYRWDFGDGTVIETETPGQPYPKPSDVIHMYQRSSAGLPHGYPVEVTFVFGVSYRVNGGPWQTLPGITRTASRDYPVQESQAVIQR